MNFGDVRRWEEERGNHGCQVVIPIFPFIKAFENFKTNKQTIHLVFPSRPRKEFSVEMSLLQGDNCWVKFSFWE